MSYTTLAVIHAIAAYVWFASLFGSLVYATLSTRRSRDGAIVGALAMLRFSTRIGLPAAIVLVIAGIWMMSDAGLNYGATWVSIGFAAWILAAFVGSGLMHPMARRLRRADAGSEDAVIQAKRILWVGAAQIIVIAIAIWAMTTQPG